MNNILSSIQFSNKNSDQYTQSITFHNINTTIVITKKAEEIILSYFKSIPIDSIITYEQTNNSMIFDNKIKILISKPTFKYITNKVEIHLFFYKGISNKFIDTIKFNIFWEKSIIFLSSILSELFCKEVSLIITEIHYPYLNSTIFAKYLAHNSSTNTFVHFQDAILTYPSKYSPPKSLLSHISGIKIELSGRLATQRVIPRVTKKSSLYGSFTNASYIDYSKYTTKNFMGTFTIKV